MQSWSLKVAVLLVMAFALIAAGLVLAQPGATTGVHMLPMEASLAALGLSLLVSLATLLYLVRRVGETADAVAAWHGGGASAPLRLPRADAGGDELARLCAQVERLAQRLGDQHRALEQAERRRQELMANMSHDLRTPLASIQGFLELMLLRHGSLAPTEQRAYLQTAVRQSEKLSRLVGDLSELARLEAGEMQLRSEDFALAELAQDVAQHFSTDATQRGINLSTRCGDAPESLQVRADLALVARVLESLLDNALRHTPAGGSVMVAVDRQGARTRITVRDSGTGICAADLAGIFERYDRAARVRTAQGSQHPGLGLAIARRIVRLHGADLSVHSQFGQGTEVSFDLPSAAAARATLALHGLDGRAHDGLENNERRRQP
jgi:signal transduction histidine kinase